MESRNRTSMSGRATHGFLSEKDFAGATPEIGGVLCLAIEVKVTRKVTYTKFKDMLANYLIKHMKDSIEIVDAVTNNTHPVAEYEKKFNAKSGKVPAAGSIKEMLLHKEVKIYVARTKCASKCR